MHHCVILIWTHGLFQTFPQFACFVSTTLGGKGHPWVTQVRQSRNKIKLFRQRTRLPITHYNQTIRSLKLWYNMECSKITKCWSHHQCCGPIRLWSMDKKLVATRECRRTSVRNWKRCCPFLNFTKLSRSFLKNFKCSIESWSWMELYFLLKTLWTSPAILTFPHRKKN